MQTANFFHSLPAIRKAVFLFTVLIPLTFSACNQEAEQAPAISRMTLSGNLDGKPWQADGFLVEKHATPPTGEHLLIQSRSNTGAIRLYINLYGVDKPGTYVIDSKTNTGHKDARLEITGTPQGFSSFFGWGPATYTITKIEGNRYTGTFSASFYDMTRDKTIELKEGKLDVWEGVQAE